MRKDVLIMAVIFIVVIGGIVFLASRSGQTSSTAINTSGIVRDTNHMTGSKNAKVTVIEFGDYQCPACGVAYPVMKQVLAEYQSNPDFNFVFKNFPLPVHQNALPAAEAAEAAAAQGKFWEMYDKLYSSQTAWSELPSAIDTFTQYAKDLGLDTNRFKKEVEQNKYSALIQSDQSDGNAIGINATPTFYVNGTPIVGVPSLQQMKDLIDADLKK